jgi:hypothetical protein
MSRAQCLECEDVIESKHRHDFVRCSCGKSFLDGGDDYLRGGGYIVPILDAMDEDMFEDPLLDDDDTNNEFQDFNLGYQAGTLDERDRILHGIQKLEDQSNATRTPLYQETMFAKIREIIHG